MLPVLYLFGDNLILLSSNRQCTLFWQFAPLIHLLYTFSRSPTLSHNHTSSPSHQPSKPTKTCLQPSQPDY